MTAASTEEVTEVWEVEDLDVPCDWGDESRAFGPHDDPARWVMWTKDHGCGVRIKLACTRCKDLRMSADPELSVICRHCLLVTYPPCKAYTRIEALK